MVLKICSRCKLTKYDSQFHKNKSRPDGLAHWCKDCLNQHNRGWKKRNPGVMKAYYATTDYKEYIRKYMEKYRKSPDHVRKIAARRILFKAVENGVVEKPTLCEKLVGCTGRLEAHHEDYSRPLEVHWLCRSHHEQLHHKD
jgi:hypothetical protein